MDDSMLIEILKEMQKKYQCISEIEHITTDMGDSLSRNDRTSVQILLGMRQEEMDKIEICNRNLHCLAAALPSEEEMNVRRWIRGEEPPENADNPLIGKLVEKGKNIELILNRTIEIDRHISMRLAGKDSFYK